MIEKRRRQIKDKRITANDIRRIGKTLDELGSEFVQANYADVDRDTTRGYKLRFQITTNDDIEYTSDTLAIFASDGILDSKVVNKIWMTFTDWNYNVQVSIHLEHADIVNYIEVEGTDSTWVNGTFGRLQACVDSWEDQDIFVKKHVWIASLLVGAFVGWAIAAVIVRIISFVSDKGELSIFSPYTLIGLWCGLAVVFPLADVIRYVWPDIEIVPTPEHEQKLSKIRRRILWVISVVMIPFVMEIIARGIS